MPAQQGRAGAADPALKVIFVAMFKVSMQQNWMRASQVGQDMPAHKAGTAAADCQRSQSSL